MPKESEGQKKTVERVMHEFKHGELEQRGGRKVKNPKQAIAIALHEAGASNRESPKKNAKALARTKQKERRGETAMAEKEGKTAQRKITGDGGRTKSELYAEARKRDIPGRSRMSKAQLERALHH